MTTTTAQAGDVMSWIEFLLQTAWTDLNVPRDLGHGRCGRAWRSPVRRRAPLSSWPSRGTICRTRGFHTWGVIEISFAGVLLRLIRLSFSGELAYEIYAPADYGVALWEHILSSAGPLGIRPIGLEAVASLRIEKGHVAGLELDHRNTLR